MAGPDGYDAGIAAAGRDCDPAPGSPVQGCPGKPCDQLWADVKKQVQKTAAMTDPFARNRQISAQYAQLYETNHNLQWVGLGSIVSRQAGCAMEKAKDKSESWLPPIAKPAGSAFHALADANRDIYSDIYPAAKFYNDNGLERLKACNTGPNGRPMVSPKLVSALEQIDHGTPQSVRAGSDQIANFEQRDVIQDQVYSNPEYKKAFEGNETAYKYYYGRPFGAQAPELPLSSQCGQGTPVPFKGSINNPDDRVGYYKALMDQYSRQTQASRDAMAQDIIRQGQGGH